MADRCLPYCDAMCEANARLETVTLGSGSVRPRSAMPRPKPTASARIAMLEHFYAMAAELPLERRKEYLRKMLPLVIDSCGAR